MASDLAKRPGRGHLGFEPCAKTVQKPSMTLDASRPGTQPAGHHNDAPPRTLGGAVRGRAREIVGRELLRIHPQVRNHRGLVDVEVPGDVAVLVSELGLCGLEARLAVDEDCHRPPEGVEGDPVKGGVVYHLVPHPLPIRDLAPGPGWEFQRIGAVRPSSRCRSHVSWAIPLSMGPHPAPRAQRVVAGGIADAYLGVTLGGNSDWSLM